MTAPAYVGANHLPLLGGPVRFQEAATNPASAAPAAAVAPTRSNLPFGQGESMTILQLASIYQTFANDGVRIPPRIVASVTNADGTVTPRKQPAGIEVVTPETAKTVRTMLESVVMPGGTGIHAAVPGYRVAGKDENSPAA